jgi:lysophospholipase L1-like esterase
MPTRLRSRRPYSHTRATLSVIAWAALLLPAPLLAGDAPHESSRRIAVWGSSVAKGSGDEALAGGYAGRLKTLLEPRGWSVFNQSRGGDNTVTIAPRFEPGIERDAETLYLTDVDPGYVVIGLSLGNEGIAQCQFGRSQGCTSTMAAADAVFEQFAAGLQGLVARARTAGITPVIALAYARGDFSEREYAFTRHMNLLINSWDVPSVNLLGAVEDGHGRWARGLWADPWHPNAAGYEEMLHAFVPSLFAALDAGKPNPALAATGGFARVAARDKNPPISFSVTDVMRSFSMTFSVRPAADGSLASINGELLEHEFRPFRRSYNGFEWDTESLLLRAAAEPLAATIAYEDGRLVYRASRGERIVSPPLERRRGWHQVTLTHYAARGETRLYVDGRFVGAVSERLQPARFTLGGDGGADFRHWFVHRAGLTGDEVAALHGGALLQASLEVYAPLSDAAMPLNRAQSLTPLTVDPEAVSFMTAPAASP